MTTLQRVLRLASLTRSATARVGDPGVAPVTRVRYRPELDGIRGVAILMVLIGHANVPYLSAAGRTGVALFFVLSGYLITSLLIAERERTGRIDFRAFYERRIRRLMPAAIAVIVVTGGVAYGLHAWPDYPLQALATLFYVNNLAWSFGLNMEALSHMWSLSLEEQFYLVWPPLFLLLGRRAVPWLVLALVAIVAIRPFTLGDTPATWLRTDIRADAIAAGCLLAFVRWQPSRWVALIGVFVVGYAAVVSAPFALQFTLDTIGSVLVVAGAATIPALTNRPIVRVGEISYGLYLWMALPVAFLWPLTSIGYFPAMVAVWVITFALALVSERWIERPWRRRSVREEAATQGRLDAPHAAAGIVDTKAPA